MSKLLTFRVQWRGELIDEKKHIIVEIREKRDTGGVGQMKNAMDDFPKGKIETTGLKEKKVEQRLDSLVYFTV